MPDDLPAFSWSRSKRDENWRIRKVDFAVAVGIFDDPDRLEAPDTRIDYGEERFQALGTTDKTLYFIVYTWRGQVRHIITAWKVGKRSAKRYRDLLARRHRTDEIGE
ncbi:MAG: BrnT family toxin [Hyphomicrobiales bacterium]